MTKVSPDACLAVTVDPLEGHVAVPKLSPSKSASFSFKNNVRITIKVDIPIYITFRIYIFWMAWGPLLGCFHLYAYKPILLDFHALFLIMYPWSSFHP